MTNTQKITRLAILLAIALSVQMMHLPTFITGPAVNGVLITAALFVGMLGGVIIGAITPLGALLLGVVHPIVAPLVPVIAAANAILVIVFKLLEKRNQYVALAVAAVAKFLLFYFAIKTILNFTDLQLPPPVILAFQLPQLYTALAGGLIAVFISRRLQAR